MTATGRLKNGYPSIKTTYENSSRARRESCGELPSMLYMLATDFLEYIEYDSGEDPFSGMSGTSHTPLNTKFSVFADRAARCTFSLPVGGLSVVRVELSAAEEKSGKLDVTIKDPATKDQVRVTAVDVFDRHSVEAFHEKLFAFFKRAAFKEGQRGPVA